MKIKNEVNTEVKRKQILNVSKEIIIKDGLESLSIRKIAGILGYTPGSIYYYFKSKKEILLSIAAEGYSDIVRIITSVDNSLLASEVISITFRNYINYMLENIELFKIILLEDIEELRDKVNILDEGISSKRNSISMLCKTIERGIQEGEFCCNNIELKAQIIWASAYGLITRLTIESRIPDNQKNKLIDELIDFILLSLKK